MPTTPTAEHGSPGDGRVPAVAMVLGGILSVQLGSALVTTIFDDLGPGGAVLLRTTFAAAVLIAIWRPARSALHGETARMIALYGVVLALMNLSFYEALERLPLGIAVTLEFTGPLAVALLGSRSRADVLWALIAGGGIVLFAPDIGDGLDPAGVAFALFAGSMWASYILLAARVGRGPAGVGGLSVAMLIAAAILIPVGIGSAGTDLLQPAALATGFAVAMLSSAIPYVLELEALRRLPANVVGVLLSLEPAAAALIGTIALGQALAGRELLAIALVVIASAGALRSSPEPPAPEV
ncbi:MAG: EamA family transporter [Solirubrobacterales bacterium]